MVRNNHHISQTYFELRGATDGGKFANENAALRRAVAPVLARRASGRALMVGWSPTLMFTPPAAERFVIADFAAGMLRNVPRRPNVTSVCAKAERLPFDRGCFDTVFTVGLLHHLAEDNTVETDTIIHATLKEIARVMHRESAFYIVEPFVSPFLEVVNRALFFLARLFMNGRGLPMMCLFSIRNLESMLENVGLELRYDTPIGIDARVPVSWFASNFKLPYRFLPQKIHLLEVHKKKEV